MFLCYTDWKFSCTDWKTFKDSQSSVCFCLYMDTSWRIRSMNSKETFSRDAAHLINLHSYSCPSIWIFLNHVIKSWHICEELELNAKCSSFGGISSLWRFRMNAINNFYTFASFTKCEILVWNMWRIGINFSQCEICEMWNLQFNKDFTARKSNFVVGVQHRRRPACASAQSGQQLCCLVSGK